MEVYQTNEQYTTRMANLSIEVGTLSNNSFGPQSVSDSPNENLPLWLWFSC